MTSDFGKLYIGVEIPPHSHHCDTSLVPTGRTTVVVFLCLSVCRVSLLFLLYIISLLFCFLPVYLCPSLSVSCLCVCEVVLYYIYTCVE